MNIIEDRVREALDESARTVPVDTTRLWHETTRRMARRGTRRSRRFGVLTPLAAVTAVSLAAVGIPAGASALHLALDGPAVASDPAPPASRAATPHPTASPVRTGPADEGEYAWTLPPTKAWSKVRSSSGTGTTIIPVDFARAPDGDFVLYASYQSGPMEPRPGHRVGMCWASIRVADGVGGGACERAGVPAKDPYATSNRWLTDGGRLDYPHYGGDGLTSPMRLQLSAGQASTRAARVDGIDTQGRHHEAKLIGADEGWPTLQYFIVVPDRVRLERYVAYDAAGRPLGDVRAGVDAHPGS